MLTSFEKRFASCLFDIEDMVKSLPTTFLILLLHKYTSHGLGYVIHEPCAVFTRVGKTGSLGPWSRVIVYCSKLSFYENYSPIALETLLQYTMTLLQGPKDPVRPY